MQSTRRASITASRRLQDAPIEILAEALPEIILKIYFPKTMYWTGKSGPRFIRPIRWIVALLGAEVVEFELAGVRSGAVSNGHRILGAQFPVTIEDYDRLLRENFVLLSAKTRREKIRAEIRQFHSQVRPDAALEDVLVYLTEYPTAILGNFDPQFLALPKEVLITVMKHHQKFFRRRRQRESRAAFHCGDEYRSADPDGLVRQGNERVLRARFNDAQFFWDADQRRKLADRLPDLANVTFQAKLGSYLEKTERVMDLVKQIGGDEFAVRAAQLSKCDLTTELVKEFTELQGVIGGLYARAQGEPEAVAQAIYDHYKPVSMEDSIPGTLRRAAGLARRQARHAARMLRHRDDPHRLARSVRAAAGGAGRGQDPGRGQAEAFALRVIGSTIRSFRNSCSTACATTSKRFADSSTTR